MTSAEEKTLTAFQLFTLDMKSKHANVYENLSPLEMTRKIAFEWTRMTQAERLWYYERIGRVIDRDVGERIRLLCAERRVNRDNDNNAVVAKPSVEPREDKPRRGRRKRRF